MAAPAIPAGFTVRRQTGAGRITLALCALALVAILAMPWWAGQGLIRDMVTLCCYIAIAQMWNLLAGYAGLVSVGQQAFMGVAGYMMFVMAQNWGINPFVAAGLCLIAPAILAVPTYALLHRLDGPYFAIGTWVVAEVCRLIASNLAIVNAGGGMSLRVMSDFSAHQRAVGVTILCAVMLLATLGGSYLLLRSRFGLALTAMRDNPVAAASQGVNVGRLRFLVFIGAAIGSGMAGAVYFMAQLRITPPSAFDANWANLAIFIVMIGGIGSLEGVLIGATIYFLADRWFGEFGASYLIVLGLLTMLTALFFRSGIWGYVGRRFDISLFPTRRTFVASTGQIPETRP